MQKLSFLITFLILYTFTQPTGTLQINFNKTIHNGNLLIYIYNNSEGFPKRKDLAYRTVIRKVNHTKSITIDKLPYGTYAIIIIHDQNNNRKMDRNRIGLPAEPYALSKKPPFRFGPPRFDDVKFVFHQSKQNLQVSF